METKLAQTNLSNSYTCSRKSSTRLVARKVVHRLVNQRNVSKKFVKNAAERGVIATIATKAMGVVGAVEVRTVREVADAVESEIPLGRQQAQILTVVVVVLQEIATAVQALRI
mmetsp:Transcript_4162/g.5562  ORF Transcript_4162/g.5562 Transcript_4162/m.5562 type:complete len:113 (+) Transcript_4162:2005-2343(+)